MERKLSDFFILAILVSFIIYGLIGLNIKPAYADGPQDISSSVSISNAGFYKNMDDDGKVEGQADQIYSSQVVNFKFNFEITDKDAIKPGNYFTGSFQAANPTNLSNAGFYFRGADIPIYSNTDKGNVQIGTAYVSKDGKMRFVLNENVKETVAIKNGLFFIKFQGVNTTGDPSVENVKSTDVDIAGKKYEIKIKKAKSGGGFIYPYYKAGIIDFDRSDKDNIYIQWYLNMNPSEDVSGAPNFKDIKPKKITIDGKDAYKGFEAKDHLGKGQVFDSFTDFAYSPDSNAASGQWGIFGVVVRDPKTGLVDNDKTVEAINRILRIRESMYDKILEENGFKEKARDDSSENGGYSFVKLDPKTNALTYHLNAVEWAQTDHFNDLHENVFGDMIYRFSPYANDYRRIKNYISEDDWTWIKKTGYTGSFGSINLQSLLGRSKHWKLSYATKATDINQLWYTNTADATVNSENGTETFPAPARVENLIAGAHADLKIGTLLIKKVVEKNGSVNPNQPLEGVEFALCDSYGNEIKGVNHAFTDTNGEARFERLDQTYYSIKEVKAPDWIELDSSSDGIQIIMPNDKGLYKVVGNNIKTTEVSAKKIWKDKDPSKRPELYLELQRRIKGEEGAWEKVPETELKNTINPWGGDRVKVVWHDIDEFAYGGKPYEFKVVEVDSNGDVWQGNKDWQKPKIKQTNKDKNSKPAFNVVNAPQSKTLRLTKQGKGKDGKTLLNLEGAQFQLYVNKKPDGSGKYVKAKGKYANPVETNKYGFIDFKNLSDGYYKIEETVAPAGYQRVEPIVVNIDGNRFRVSDDGGQTWRTKDKEQWIELNSKKRFEFSVEDQRALEIPVSGSSQGLVLKLAAFAMSIVSGLLFYASNYKEY